MLAEIAEKKDDYDEFHEQFNKFLKLYCLLLGGGVWGLHPLSRVLPGRWSPFALAAGPGVFKAGRPRKGLGS